MSSYRLLVAGSRGLTPGPNEFDLALTLLLPLSHTPVITIVHGTAKGVDQAGAEWAKERGWRVEGHRADWNAHGKSAGFIRNTEMVSTGIDGAIFFWDGKSRGTQHTMGLVNSSSIPYVTVVFPAPPATPEEVAYAAGKIPGL